MFILKEGNYTNCCKISINEEKREILVETEIFNLNDSKYLNIEILKNTIYNLSNKVDPDKNMKIDRLTDLLNYFLKKEYNKYEICPFIYYSGSIDEDEEIKLLEYKDCRIENNNLYQREEKKKWN